MKGTKTVARTISYDAYKRVIGYVKDGKRVLQRKALVSDKTEKLRRLQEVALLAMNFFMGLKQSDISMLKWRDILINEDYGNLVEVACINNQSINRTLFLTKYELRSALRQLWSHQKHEFDITLDSPVISSVQKQGHLKFTSVRRKLSLLYKNAEIYNVGSQSGHNSLKQWLEKENICPRLKGVILNNRRDMRLLLNTPLSGIEIEQAKKIMETYPRPIATT